MVAQTKTIYRTKLKGQVKSRITPIRMTHKHLRMKFPKIKPKFYFCIYLYFCQGFCSFVCFGKVEQIIILPRLPNPLTTNTPILWKLDWKLSTDLHRKYVEKPQQQDWHLIFMLQYYSNCSPVRISIVSMSKS